MRKRGPTVLGIAAMTWCALLAAGCGTGEQPPKFTEPRVVMREGVQLRMAPAEFAGVVAELALGTPVTAVPEGAEVSHDDAYVELQLGDGRSGFLDRVHLGTDDEWQRVTAMRASLEGIPPQATGVLATRANLRLEPGRDSRVLDSIAGKTPFSMYRRVGVMHGEDKEIYYLVDVGEGRVGYVFTRKLDFDVPDGLPGHVRYRRAVAWQLLAGDDAARPAYLVATVGDGDRGCDFDRVEIYDWDHSVGAYGTMFTRKGLRGVLPLTAEQVDGRWQFEIRELADEGVTVTRWEDRRPARVIETRSEPASGYLH